jgi:hypothetical protein
MPMKKVSRKPVESQLKVDENERKLMKEPFN